MLGMDGFCECGKKLLKNTQCFSFTINLDKSKFKCGFKSSSVIASFFCYFLSIAVLIGHFVLAIGFKDKNNIFKIITYSSALLVILFSIWYFALMADQVPQQQDGLKTCKDIASWPEFEMLDMQCKSSQYVAPQVMNFFAAIFFIGCGIMAFVHFFFGVMVSELKPQ